MELPEARPVPLWARAALFVPFAWWTARIAGGASPWCFLDFVNLAFHEAGHLAFAPFGSTLGYLGGTLGQLLVPLGLVPYFVATGRRVGAWFCVAWVGESLVNVSVYMADARTLALPLVGGGDHDWNELFYRFGLLSEDAVARVSGATHAAGLLLMLAGCVLLFPREILWRARGR